jgi:hypothetical protein
MTEDQFEDALLNLLCQGDAEDTFADALGVDPDMDDFRPRGRAGSTVPRLWMSRRAIY